MTGISVIIPIYNVENYLEDCLNSLITSSKLVDENKFEVILVNDGSTDGSGILAGKFAEQTPNFHYYEKSNGGLGDARNYGLTKARFEYIAFIDSDDKISEDFLEVALDEVEKDPDLVIFDWFDYYSDESTTIIKGIEKDSEIWTVQPAAWNKIYHKRLFENTQFPIRKLYEDVGVTYKVISQIKNYKYINKPLYYYRRNREGSILNTVNNKINDIYDVLDNIKDYYKKTDSLNNKNYDGLCYQYLKLLMWSNMYRQIKYYRFNIFGFYRKMKSTRNEIYNLFPDWKENLFIKNNESYFLDRFGEKYIERLDGLGKNLISTLNIYFILVFKKIRN
ncbi:glycosyltransferase family 2 protein [Niallia taxi]|uniref:Glycosyltransferase family 2 protein n=1 Tax=Niallia taxi TaxID=2499688 RepID=A0A437KCG8_9BACI|nr:glycosyltransferase family 2 protein [Niallia taxi]RVT63848.1 glycosyltransferase family 2 protein [Niallia taxi]